MFLEQLVRQPGFAKDILHAQPQQPPAAAAFRKAFGHGASQSADDAVFFDRDDERRLIGHRAHERNVKWLDG